MTRFKTILIAAACSSILAGCGGSSGSSRDAAWAVGSSTVYPFAAAVAEETAKGGVKAPKVEQNGTGAGMKLFCGGVGAQHPDIADASRRMKKSEYEDCVAHGVNQIAEIQVGLDGIAFAEAKGGPGLALTPVDVYKALAANPFGKPNTAKTWKDVNPALPDLPILVYGPPSTSGTRDALAELILTKGCETDPAMKALKETNKDAAKKTCTEVREGGYYVDSGEADNLIVQKISENPNAVGIFGYSYLEENQDNLKGVTINGIEPTYASISDFTYPGARPLYIYVKLAHLTAIPGLREYVGAWARMWGPDGALKAKGMVVAPEAVRTRSAELAQSLAAMDPSGLK
jgi:phosphate transport system substrate-binding protein